MGTKLIFYNLQHKIPRLSITHLLRTVPTVSNILELGSNCCIRELYIVQNKYVVVQKVSS